MAVSLEALKCPQCAGKLIYSEQNKCLQCDSCGFLTAIKEEYDGLHTIKSVVRQALIEASYRRIDACIRQIGECEQIDPRYVGTIIARIAYELTAAITPGVCQPHEVNNMFARLKQDYGELKSKGVTAEETLLYDSLSSADAFATLALVYDTLGDFARRDDMLKRLDTSKIYSVPANMNLLGYLLKAKDAEAADGILANTSAIVPKEALRMTLDSYPDCDKKADNAEALIKCADLSYEDKAIIEDYLSISSDCADTKRKIAESAMRAGVVIGTECLLKYVLDGVGANAARSVLSLHCAKKLGDTETAKIISFAFGQADIDTALAVLDCMDNGIQYVVISVSSVVSMLSAGNLSLDGRLKLLDRLSSFNIGGSHGFADVLSDYLLNAADPPNDRIRVVKAILGHTDSVTTSCVEKYVLKSTADGNKKPDMIGLLFGHGLNLSYYSDLVGKYLAAPTDPPDIRLRVVTYLCGLGLKADPLSFSDYIGLSAEAPDTKLEITRILIRSGSVFSGKTAAAYLEHTDAKTFSAELFGLIVDSAERVGTAALLNYLIGVSDSEALKTERAAKLADAFDGDITSARCRVSHLGKVIECSILQAYILCTADSPAVAQAVASDLAARKFRINAEMNVGGVPMKLKKYAAAEKARISPVTDMLCEKLKVYSLFA